MIARWTPIAFLALFAGIGIGWRIWLQRRRFGHSGLALFRSDRWTQHLRDASPFAVGLLIIAQAIAPQWAPARPGLGGAGFALGCVLAFGGLALMVRAQLDMGASWRIGVDRTSRPGLITHGLYRWTRNPIYLAMFVAFGGLLLMTPSWLMLLALVVSAIAVRSQVREEEAHLLRTYGDEFRRYAAHVGRFLPGLGRSRGPGDDGARGAG